MTALPPAIEKPPCAAQGGLFLVKTENFCYNNPVGRQVYGVVPPRWRTKAEEVMLMSNVELLNTLLAVAGLVLSAYAIGRQSRR